MPWIMQTIFWNAHYKGHLKCAEKLDTTDRRRINDNCLNLRFPEFTAIEVFNRKNTVIDVARD